MSVNRDHAAEAATLTDVVEDLHRVGRLHEPLQRADRRHVGPEAALAAGAILRAVGAIHPRQVIARRIVGRLVRNRFTGTSPGAALEQVLQVLSRGRLPLLYFGEPGTGDGR